MIIVKKDSIISRVEDNGDAFLFNTLNGQFKRLNRTGAFLWEICSDKKIDEIIELLCEKYPNMSKCTVEHDVKAFFDSMYERKLIDYKSDT